MYNIAFGIFTGIIFMSLIVLFCVLLVKLHIRKIKNYTKVIYEKDLDFQKTLNTTIIETQEQVLNNISQDLHDDAGQQLTYINFQLENIKLDSPELQALLDPVSESVGNLSKSIRGISHSLNNQLLMQQDLLKAILAEVERLQKNTAISITFERDPSIRKVFGTNEKIVIYRIFQEIINNTLKHSKASNITIALQNKRGFEMTVHDNGKGFHYPDIKNGVTLGLSNMVKRAAVINYGIDIQSVPGAGTTIVLSENTTHN
jgi:signal transduction histidine kinase